MNDAEFLAFVSSDEHSVMVGLEGKAMKVISDSWANNWHPANGGTEEPFVSKSGKRLLYCWQPSTGRHAYLDLSTDMILSDEEAQYALGNL